MQKTAIGGDRLGAGGRMNVNLKPYERSTHDLGYIWRSTMAAGTLIPFMVIPALPGDTFDFKLTADVKTHPALGPLFGSFKLQLDIFEAPVRLYHSALLQNTQQIGNAMASVLLPQIVSDQIGVVVPGTINQNPDSTQISQSALLAYLGVRGWGLNTQSGTPTRALNAIPLMAYWEIYRNYYANKQEPSGYFIFAPAATVQGITSVTLNGNNISQGANTPPGSPLTPGSNFVINFTSGQNPDLTQVLFNTSAGIISAQNLGSWTGTTTTSTLNTTNLYFTIQIYGWSYANAASLMKIQQFTLTNIDVIKQQVFANNPITRYNLQSSSADPYGSCLKAANLKGSQCGLGIKTYQSDLFNNWMQTAWYTSIQTTTQVSTAGNVFKIDALILARKVYDLLNRIAISGGTYQDWINAAYDHEPFSMCITPVYHGGLSKEVVFQEVVQLAPGTTAQPTGTLVGKGTMHSKHKGGDIRIKIHEHAYLIGIVSLTPRLDYSQGNDWHTYGLTTMDDFHKPALDQIGFQQLITEQLAWWDTQWTPGTGWIQQSAGFQPAWLNYMTNINKCYGNFASVQSEMFMTLNRRYQMDPTTGRISDLTTYIDPTHYNFIFAQTSLDAQNFWTQIAIDCTARRKMSAKIMPNL